MSFRTALLGASASLLLAGLAQADGHAHKGWYVSLAAGLNWIDAGEYLNHSAGSITPGGTFFYESGHAIAGAVGRGLGSKWRAEFELGVRGNDVQRSCPTIGSCVASVVDVTAASQMINVFHDIPLADQWTASLGVGLGGNHVTVGHFTTQDIDDYVFAAQAIAQVSYRLSERIGLFADFRHMEMDGPLLEFPAAAGTALEIEKSDSSVMFGMRFNLQAPVARKIDEPKPEKPVVEAPKQFIVFFGFNKSNLTAEAVRVVADAAEAAKKHGSAAISIVGHTDTSGSTDYNMALSMRRSQAVKDSLVAHGIDGSMISTGGRGETELMVSTGDGVKEPQNRRATIDLK